MERIFNMTNLKEYDISCEEYREYEFGGTIYKISNPKTLFYRDGGSTHRVVDMDNIVHCVPSVGVNGCILRWKTKNPNNPVNF